MDDRIQKKNCLRIYRPLNYDDPDVFDCIFRKAESTFRQMVKFGLKLKIPKPFCRKTLDNLVIQRVDFIENGQVESAFQRQKEEFQRKAICSDEVYLFHGTNPKSVSSIMTNNFEPNHSPIGAVKSACYGQGNLSLISIKPILF